MAEAPEAAVALLKTGVLMGVRDTGRFYDECKRRYSLKLWKAFNMVFNCLPIAAIVSSWPPIACSPPLMCALLRALS